MTGKRIVFIMADFIVLLLLTIYVMTWMFGDDRPASIIGDGGEGVSSISGELDSEVVASSSEIQTDSMGVPKVDLVLRSMSGTTTAKVDLFAVSRSAVVGRDTKAGVVMSESGTLTYEEMTKGESEQRIRMTGKTDAYAREVTLVALGVGSGSYTLIGSWQDASGRTHSVSEIGELGQHDYDTYTLNLDSGQMTRERTLYPGDTAATMLEPNGATECDYEGLRQQLETELESVGWEAPDVGEVTWHSGLYKPDAQYPAEALVFDYDEICAVEVVFRESYLTAVPDSHEYHSLPGMFTYDSDGVEIAGETFAQMLGDSPLSSQNRFPISVGGEAVQFVGTWRHARPLALKFPILTSCPCSFENRALITAPMYPPEHPLHPRD